MKQLFFLLSLSLLSPIGAIAQQFQLFAEDFEQGNLTFTLNQDGPNAAAGSNSWIINDEYDGKSIYPNTISQDSTNSGTIGGAPFSTYLHIHDSVAAGTQNVSNTNWAPTVPSDNFAFISDGFCTLGITEVILQFFYFGEGDTNAYGEVYYSINGGAWVKTGKNRYVGQDRWEFEPFISDPAFENVEDLRFGFRWVNGGGTPPGRSSLGIDDIIVVGTYDPVNSPVSIEVDQVFPDPVCQENNLVILWSLSAPLCDGDYRIELSNSNGSFSNPVNLGFFPIAAADTIGAIAATIPATTNPGACYKVRVRRIAPAPTIVGVGSVCFEVQACPNIIETLGAVVTNDPDTVCSLSAIDVSFTSTGVYAANNIYTAELSDPSGGFSNPMVLGTLPSRENFDPALGKMPGSVSGLIPSVPEGCNYFIRVVSSNPSAIGSVYGPFCIKQCDIETNDLIDISVCIMETVGVDTLVNIEINSWDSLATYCDTNSFQVQLLDMMSLAVVNVGGLGVIFDTTSTQLTLSIPGLFDLLNLGIQPGSYYMRIIADCSNRDWDLNGTIVRLTIGAPADNPSFIIPSDTLFCNNQIVSFAISPYNPESEYQWLSPALNNGAPFIWPGSVLNVDFTGATPDVYTFFVQEINFGCFGPLSEPVEVLVITTPSVNIQGPPIVCVGDTVTYTVPFIPTTFYDWDLSFGTIVDTSNNELIITFDSVGTAEIDLFALNSCGSSTSNPFQVEIITLLDVDAGLDTTICSGDTVQLATQDGGLQKELVTTFSSTTTRKGVMFDVVAIDKVTLAQFATNFSSSTVAADIEIYYKQGTHDGFETIPGSWTQLGVAPGVANQGQNVPTDLPIPVNITMLPGERYGFYIMVTDNSNQRFTVDNTTPLLDLVTSDGVLEVYKGKFLSGLFSGPSDHMVWNGIIQYFTKSGLSFDWSSGDTTETTLVAPDVTTTYTVSIRDTLGCRSTDDVVVNVNPTPLADAGIDELICVGETITLNATGGNVYVWDDNDELSATDISNPQLSPRDDQYYVVTVIDSASGCEGIDSVFVETTIDEFNEDTVLFCPDLGSVELAVTDQQQGATYEWNTGETTSSINVGGPGVFLAEVRPSGSQCIMFYNFEVLADECVVDLKPPDAFTPNGDGRNDFFTVYGVDIVKYDIKIFNRWGEVVYVSNDPGELNDLSRGWDGTHLGKLQDTGTFVYYIEAENRFGFTINAHGDLTLIR